MSTPSNAWPTDNRAESSTSHRKGKRKQRENPTEGYPTLVPGLLSSATLLERPNGRLEWSTITGAMNKRKRARISARDPVTLFPPTRTPELPLPHTTIQQKAEEGANFLRTFLPDVDVTAELIREEITHDEELARDTVTFDPLAGNTLAPVVYYDTPTQATTCLAFPTGELGSDLNISPYTHNADEGTTFIPQAHPARTFPTPIQQIVAHSPASGIWNQSTYLAVRTLGATHISQLRAQASTSAIQLEDRLILKRAHTGAKYIVDMGFQPSGPTLVAVNDQGGSVVQPLDTTSQDDQFWRLGLNPSTSTFLLASSSAVRRIDPRTSETPAPIFSLAKPPERITAVEDDPSEKIIRLCTTSQLLWLDSRYPTRPLLSYVHGRQYDPSLQLHTARVRVAPFSFLSSPHNGLVTVYDVSRGDGDLIYTHTSPYALSSIPAQSIVGQTLFRHPSLKDDDSTLSCIRLDARGELTCIDLHLGDEGENMTRTGVRWSQEVKELVTTAENAEPDSGPLGMQDKVEMNLRPAYDRVFRQYDEERRIAQEQDTESVYDLLDNVPNYWQQADEYPDHILTTYDVLFRSGDEPKNPSRADFLTQSAINSLRGYRALVQDRIPLDSMRKGAKWHWDMGPSLARLDSDFESRDVGEMEEQLRRWKLAGEEGRAAEEGSEGADDSPEGTRTAASLRRETEARHQLTLDLALSRHVFSARLFVPPTEESDDLEAMTSALSIDTEPPPVHFSYLTPLKKDHYARDAGPTARNANATSDPNTTDIANTTLDSNAADTSDQPLTLPPGPRLLLSEWTLGDDPSEYEFHDSYDADAAERSPPVARRKAAKPTSTAGILSAELQQRSQPPFVVASQPPPVMASQPPPVVASQRPPAVSMRAAFPSTQRPPAFASTQPPARRPLQAAGSEPNMMDVGQSQPTAEFSQSQSQGMDFMPSTQVLPGPFGGRPAPKKKAAKKRVGGF
ncbi:hypothetical protein K523DRAFT_280073 [Schizophyllum commune Tattone D]|nr:hypothetical protein K523DRAFT_280073 [Schizophyllum commune Tattone D]